MLWKIFYYRIDWARHPEKYKDLENLDNEKQDKNPASKQNKPKKKR